MSTKTWEIFSFKGASERALKQGKPLESKQFGAESHLWKLKYAPETELFHVHHLCDDKVDVNIVMMIGDMKKKDTNLKLAKGQAATFNFQVPDVEKVEVHVAIMEHKQKETSKVAEFVHSMDEEEMRVMVEWAMREAKSARLDLAGVKGFASYQRLNSSFKKYMSKSELVEAATEGILQRVGDHPYLKVDLLGGLFGGENQNQVNIRLRSNILQIMAAKILKSMGM